MKYCFLLITIVFCCGSAFALDPPAGLKCSLVAKIKLIGDKDGEFIQVNDWPDESKAEKRYFTLITADVSKSFGYSGGCGYLKDSKDVRMALCSDKKLSVVKLDNENKLLRKRGFIGFQEIAASSENEVNIIIDGRFELFGPHCIKDLYKAN